MLRKKSEQRSTRLSRRKVENCVKSVLSVPISAELNVRETPRQQSKHASEETMKTVRDACTLQPNALSIKLSDQIEQLDELITSEGNGTAFFEKTFITQGMQDLPRPPN